MMEERLLRWLCRHGFHGQMSSMRSGSYLDHRNYMYFQVCLRCSKEFPLKDPDNYV